MKQVVQNYRTGELKVAEVPSPQIRPSAVKVRTLYSVISAGTEKTKVDTAKMSLLQKARSRPDLVKKVLEKAKKEGFKSTYEMVQKRLSDPVPLGYSSVGIVEEVGDWVEGIFPGDLVACAGAGQANHAEYNVVPARLVAKCPNGTPLDQAALTTIGSIALQGIRQTAPLLGEKIVVVGMGLLGQITSKLLALNGCEVFCTDLDPWKLEQGKKLNPLARTALATEPTLMDQIFDWTLGRGADAVILTASTSSDQPIEQAGQMSREKGRVVIVGAVGTRFPREPYYLKEVDIRIARSYGPGRYDPLYEELGLDYPAGYVRFTEQRNMEAFLGLIADGRLNLAPLLTHRYSIQEANKAFGLLDSKNTNSEPYLGILLSYDAKTEKAASEKIKSRGETVASPQKTIRAGFIGIGNYATSQILPRLKQMKGVSLDSISSGTGMAAAIKGPQYGFEKIAESPEEIIGNTGVNTVFVMTRHDSHAQFVNQSLKAGKNVFVEKPLCMTRDELEEIKLSHQNAGTQLAVGFNRRFSPLIQMTRSLIPSGAQHLIYRVNAGKLPADHWTKISEVGGGRILGEGCHFIDLAAYLAKSRVKLVSTHSLRQGAQTTAQGAEDVHITLLMENGSVATIVYLTGGATKLPKEYIEVHGHGQSIVIDDFRSISINGAPAKKLSTQDKGQGHFLEKFIVAIQNPTQGPAPITPEEVWNSTEATIAAVESLNRGHAVAVN